MHAETTGYAFERPGVFARGWHIVCFSQEAEWGDWRFNRKRIKSHGRQIIENIVFAMAMGRAGVRSSSCT